ncbi:MFS transporter [Anaerocolumna sp. AGMB13025]|uniref:MFS transporter n=1 Tax=Anaerocolumna sp. AGMB13025 TaxID=3039116 RepID=UPI00241F6A09|nr:MFS transporter [Anaerocolumna sp. AGMB13025]WFR57654.1 MFS transporter [Anaerocolumna sp. AGMB13025]
MERLANQLTIKYAFLQSTYWICQCAIYSFAAVFLQSKNFNNMQIGIVLALAAILSIILQPVVAAFADKTKKVPLRYIVAVLMVMVYLLVILLYLLPNSFLLTAVIYVIVGAISFTLNPLFNSLALEYLNRGIPMNYGLARGMGSIAFAIMSYLLGNLVNRFGAGIIPVMFIGTYCFAILSAFLFKIELPETMVSTDLNPGSGISVTSGREPFKETAPTGILTFFIKYKKFSFFLIGVSMIFYSHSLINTYLINIMKQVGGGSTDMGISLSIAATLELPAMAGFIYIIRKISSNKLVMVAAFFFFIKAFITWLAPNVLMIHVSQACQMLSYAIFTPASVYYVNSIVEDHDKVKGQAMLGVATLGIAGSIANITGGKILDTFGVSDMLLLGTLVTALGFVIVMFSTEKPREKAKGMS